MKDDAFNKVRGKKWPFINGGKWHFFHTETNFKLTIVLFPVTEHFILELFKWEKICNSVQIGGSVMFNLFYVKKKNVEMCIYFCLYMLSIIVLRKRIGTNRYRQATGHTYKKSEIGIGQENFNRCISKHNTVFIRKLQYWWMWAEMWYWIMFQKHSFFSNTIN